MNVWLCAEFTTTSLGLGSMASHSRAAVRIVKQSVVVMRYWTHSECRVARTIRVRWASSSCRRLIVLWWKTIARPNAANCPAFSYTRNTRCVPHYKKNKTSEYTRNSNGGNKVYHTPEASKSHIRSTGASNVSRTVYIHIWDIWHTCDVSLWLCCKPSEGMCAGLVMCGCLTAVFVPFWTTSSGGFRYLTIQRIPRTRTQNTQLNIYIF